MPLHDPLTVKAAATRFERLDTRKRNAHVHIGQVATTLAQRSRCMKMMRVMRRADSFAGIGEIADHLSEGRIFGFADFVVAEETHRARTGKNVHYQHAPPVQHYGRRRR